MDVYFLTGNLGHVLEIQFKHKASNNNNNNNESNNNNNKGRRLRGMALRYFPQRDNLDCVTQINFIVCYL